VANGISEAGQTSKITVQNILKISVLVSKNDVSRSLNGCLDRVLSSRDVVLSGMMPTTSYFMSSLKHIQSSFVTYSPIGTTAHEHPENVFFHIYF